MRKLRRILAVLAILAVLGGVLWLAVSPDERLHRGKLERAWILSLNGGVGSNDLAQWRELGPEAVPILARALDTGSQWRQRAWSKLWPRLPAGLKQHLPKPADNFLLHRNAVRVLTQINCDLSPAAPALARAMNDEDAEVRVNAAKCLSEVVPKLGGEKGKLLPDFIRASTDSNGLVRESAVTFLARYTNQTSTVVPAMVKALGDSQEIVRLRAMSSLRAMNPEVAAKAGLARLLVPYLTNQDTMVRVNVAAELGAMKSDAAIVVPKLVEMLDNYLPVTRFAAANALGKFGGEARIAVPALVKALGDEPRVSNAASNALVQIDPGAAAKAFAKARAEAR